MSMKYRLWKTIFANFVWTSCNMQYVKFDVWCIMCDIPDLLFARYWCSESSGVQNTPAGYFRAFILIYIIFFLLLFQSVHSFQLDPVWQSYVSYILAGLLHYWWACFQLVWLFSGPIFTLSLTVHFSWRPSLIPPKQNSEWEMLVWRSPNWLYKWGGGGGYKAMWQLYLALDIPKIWLSHEEQSHITLHT